MPTESLSLAQLRRAGTISSSEIVAAIDAYMLDPTAKPYRFTSGHSIDVAALVALRIKRAELALQTEMQGKAFRTQIAAIIMAACPGHL